MLRFLPLVFCLLIILTGAMSFANEAPASTAELATAGRARDLTSFQDIDGVMRNIKRLLKSLEKSLVPKSDMSAVLADVVKLEEEFMKAKILIPGRAQKLDKKKKAKMIAEYRKMHCDVIAKILQMEKLVVDRKFKKAKKLINAVRAFKGKGHGKFKD